MDKRGYYDTFGGAFLPEILTTFAKSYPSVQVSVRCDPSEVLLAALTKGELDLALITGSDKEKGEVFRHDPAVWVTSPYHSVHEIDPVWI